MRLKLPGGHVGAWYCYSFASEVFSACALVSAAPNRPGSHPSIVGFMAGLSGRSSFCRYCWNIPRDRSASSRRSWWNHALSRRQQGLEAKRRCARRSSWVIGLIPLHSGESTNGAGLREDDELIL